MMVKPIAFVALATLVVIGAGTGAYLAVRNNQRPVAPIVEPGSLDSASETIAEPVQATEELISAPLASGSEGHTPDVVSHAEEAAAAAAVEKAARQPDRIPPTVTSANTAPTGETATARSQTGSAQSSGGAVAPVENQSDPQLPNETPTLLALRTVEPAAVGRPVDAEERPRIVRDLVIAADSVVGLQVDTPVSTEDAEVEDDVEARVTRDVVVDDQIAVPAGTRVLGSVVLVENAGDIRGAARLGVRFHTIVLDDVFELPIVTETVYREGKGRGGESAAKIGGAAVGGAILGAIFGGRKGAAIGSAAGAAGGTAAAMAGDGEPATLPAGSTLTVRMSRPATVTIEY